MARTLTPKQGGRCSEFRPPILLIVFWTGVSGLLRINRGFKPITLNRSAFARGSVWPGSRSHRNRSGPAGEFPRLCGNLHLFPLLNEEGNANFNASFQLRRLGHVAARRVATGAGFGIGDVELDLRWQL